MKPAEFSDDEDEDAEKPEWAMKPVVVSEATRAIAIRWLRTARSRLQAGGAQPGVPLTVGGAPSGPARQPRAASRKPGEKAPRSKTEVKSPK